MASKSKKNARSGDALTVSPQELAKRVKRFEQFLSSAERELEGLVELTTEARVHSNGRLRDGEPAAMRAILDAADTHPSYFESLAASDHGSDDRVFETQPARDDLARRDLLVEPAGRVAALAERFSDSLLALGSHAREVTMPAYALAAVHAETDSKLRTALAPASKFYGAPAQLRAKRANRAKKAKKPPVQ